MKAISHSTSYTQSVNGLLNSIQNPHNVDTLYGQATEYFAQEANDKAKLEQLNMHIATCKLKLENPSSQKGYKSLTGQLAMHKAALKAESLRQEQQRLKRLDKAIQICLEILSISEGEDFEETVHKSSKFLGTVLLLSPSHSKTKAGLHQRMKPAYRAVLSLRLLDKLMIDELIDNPYILEHYDVPLRYEAQDGNFVGITQAVILPIMMAALFQDIGLEHPKTLALLKGEDNKDVFRLLEPAERKVMLKLSYQKTQDYLLHGLGCQKYAGNSKDEQKEFDHQEQLRLSFQLSLLKDAIVSKQGFGDIIKIPQVYSSIILSTKGSYKRKDLPKAALLIEQLADKNAVSDSAARAFINIVGYFPQGYGVTYIPVDLRGYEAQGYEYAIVNSLYPRDPREPICRKVTRQLRYISSGGTEIIEQEYNLRFEIARKKLTKVERARLIEIMHKLAYQFDPADVDNLLPAFWEPHEYFSQKRNQNLWNKMT